MSSGAASSSYELPPYQQCCKVLSRISDPPVKNQGYFFKKFGVKYNLHYHFLHFFERHYFKFFKFFSFLEFKFFVFYVCFFNSNIQNCLLLKSNNLFCDFIFFTFSSWKFGQTAISPGLVVCFFSWLFWAAGARSTFF